jgi:hypothetical protein
MKSTYGYQRAWFVLVNAVCFLILVAFQPSAFAGDWRLFFDQLSYHEKSFRIMVESNGTKTAFVKERKEKDFTKQSEAKIDPRSLETLREQVFNLQSAFQRAELPKKSALDVDTRYRIGYEHHGLEIEMRWFAGQISSNQTASETYFKILGVINEGEELGLQLKPDKTKLPQ